MPKLKDAVRLETPRPPCAEPLCSSSGYQKKSLVVQIKAPGSYPELKDLYLGNDLIREITMSPRRTRWIRVGVFQNRVSMQKSRR